MAFEPKKRSETATEPKEKRIPNGRKGSGPLDTITDDEMNFCHLLISGKYTDMKAAELAGFTYKNHSQVTLLKRRPRIKQYIELYNREFALERARKEIDKMSSCDIDRVALVRHLWRLSNIDPLRTKGSITGQVEAAREIAELLGLKLKAGDKFLEGLTDEQLRNYLNYGSPDTPVKN